MDRLLAAVMVSLAIGAAILGGCKKESSQKSESQTSPATQPAPATGGGEQAKTGESMFKQYCAACHPNGGNTINANKPLTSKAMAANGITKAEDIVKVMRNPGPGMNRFDPSTISDKDATAIAQYVLATFK